MQISQLNNILPSITRLTQKLPANLFKAERWTSLACLVSAIALPILLALWVRKKHSAVLIWRTSTPNFEHSPTSQSAGNALDSYLNEVGLTYQDLNQTKDFVQKVGLRSFDDLKVLGVEKNCLKEIQNFLQNFKEFKEQISKVNEEQVLLKYESKIQDMALEISTLADTFVNTLKQHLKFQLEHIEEFGLEGKELYENDLAKQDSEEFQRSFFQIEMDSLKEILNPFLNKPSNKKEAKSLCNNLVNLNIGPLEKQLEKVANEERRLQCFLLKEYLGQHGLSKAWDKIRTEYGEEISLAFYAAIQDPKTDWFKLGLSI